MPLPSRASTAMHLLQALGAATFLAGITSTAHAASQPKYTPKPANCQNTSGPFDKWLATFRQDAAKEGISQKTLALALDGLQMDQKIIYIDRGQSFFSQPLVTPVTMLATSARIVPDMASA